MSADTSCWADTENVFASVEGRGIDYATTTPGRVRADHFSGSVSLLVAQHEGEEWPVEASACLDADSAREVATALRNGRDGQWVTETASMHLDIGWLYRDVGRTDHDDDETTVRVSHEDGVFALQIVYNDPEGEVQADTTLTREERETIAEALETAAESADAYEPPEPVTEDASPKPLRRRVASDVVSLGIPLVAVYGVAMFVMPRVASDLAVNGERVSMAGMAEVTMALILFVALILLGIKYAPGRVGGGVRR